MEASKTLTAVVLSDEKKALTFHYENAKDESYDIKKDGNEPAGILGYIEKSDIFGEQSRCPIVEDFDAYLKTKKDTEGNIVDGDFSRHIFLGEADFWSATFSGEANFWRATFSGEANFRSATFSGEAYFGMATFSGEAHFVAATFSDKAHFVEAIFSDKADFRSATFSGEAHFVAATFSDKAYFRRATFSDEAHFGMATFSGEAYFGMATFSGKAHFVAATFSDKAYFRRATFSGETNFWIATFSGEAYFRRATFSGEAHFVAATFSDKAYFMEATFSGKANFGMATFSDKADFVKATFSGEADFRRATFSGKADFNQFKCNKNIIISFERAKFDEQLLFYARKENHKFRLDLKDIIIDARLLLFNEKLPQKLLTKSTPRITFTILKDALLARNNKIDALEVFRMEMQAKKRESKQGPLGDRLILDFEETVSNFGTEPLRAVLWWFGSLIVFGLFVVLFIICSLGEIVSSEIEGQIFNYAFSPFSAFSYLEFFEKVSLVWLALITFLNFIKSALLATITYEIIKSFRKFSRGL